MPHIRVVTSASLTDGQKDEIADIISKTITVIPEKTPAATMIEILDNTVMYQDNQRQTCVFIELKIFGSATSKEKEQVIETFCREIGRIAGAEIKHVYASMLEYDGWGLRGNYLEKQRPE